ncbi:MAG: acyltransferase [Akkermansia sp.]|nr:acyltransferase [Akkermansia sp.]
MKDNEVSCCVGKLNDRKESPGLYMLKALCALFVVIYHVPLYMGRELTPVTGTAVPCFYMISGYFLFSGDAEKELKRAYSWLKKILIITILINVFYLFVNYEQVVSNLSRSPGLVIPLFFQGGVVAPHLWYLCAFWEALIVFIILRKYFSQKLLYVAPVLIFVSLCASKYSFLFGEYKCAGWLCQSFLAPAIPCLSTGYLVRKYVNCFARKGIWWILTIMFLLLIYTERYLLAVYENVHDDGSYYLFTLPLAMCFFVVALKMKRAMPLIVSIGKYHSSNVYFFHLFVAGCIASLFVSYMGRSYYFITALVVYIISILFSIAIRWGYKKIMPFFLE